MHDVSHALLSGRLIGAQPCYLALPWLSSDNLADLLRHRLKAQPCNFLTTTLIASRIRRRRRHDS